jgi:hypothetical protein
MAMALTQAALLVFLVDAVAFNDIGLDGYWWSSTRGPWPKLIGNWGVRGLSWNHRYVDESRPNKRGVNGFSVRCLAN